MALRSFELSVFVALIFKGAEGSEEIVSLRRKLLSVFNFRICGSKIFSRERKLQTLKFEPIRRKLKSCRAWIFTPTPKSDFPPSLPGLDSNQGDMVQSHVSYR